MVFALAQRVGIVLYRLIVFALAQRVGIVLYRLMVFALAQRVGIVLYRLMVFASSLFGILQAIEYVASVLLPSLKRSRVTPSDYGFYCFSFLQVTFYFFFCSRLYLFFFIWVWCREIRRANNRFFW